jgi:hypothetical protein
MDCVQFINQNGKDFWSCSPNPPKGIPVGGTDWKKYWNDCAYGPKLREGMGLWMAKSKEKKDTLWYDKLCILVQEVKETEPAASSALRNILWEQVKLLLYARVRDFINEKKSAILKRDPELCQQLYQDVFFIFQKACNIWDPARKTKFITFLGDIIDQEILNVIRLDLYHKNRDRKIFKRMSENFEGLPDKSDVDRGKTLEEVKHLFENYSFKSELERMIIRTIMYGKKGDWLRVQRKSHMVAGNFYRLKRETINRLKTYLLENGSPYLKEYLEDIIIGEKS